MEKEKKVLKKEKLLECFDEMCLFMANHGITKRDERAIAIREMIQKPEVTEEWIWKAIDYIKEYPTYHRLEEKLKEIGVEIIKK